MILKGIVQSGQNNFSYWIEKLEPYYTRKTGMKLFPGTLNVHLTERLYPLPHGCLRLEKEEYGGTVSVSLAPCTIFGRKAWILRTDTDTGKSGQPPEAILEIATDVRLRDTYSLKDGDTVEVEVPDEIIFGINDPSVHYIYRPGAYAVIFNEEESNIAIIKTDRGYFLPGGGIENGESEHICLEREALEELGWRIQIQEKIGSAKQYFFAILENAYYISEGHFYMAEKLCELQASLETTHALVWLSLVDAQEKLFHGHQRWAIEQTVRIRAKEVPR